MMETQFPQDVYMARIREIVLSRIDRQMEHATGYEKKRAVLLTALNIFTLIERSRNNAVYGPLPRQ